MALGPELGRDEDEPNSADGQMDDQRMPTTDGQMASGGSEEVVPPDADDATEGATGTGAAGTLE